MATGITTYCHGPRVYFERDITTEELTEIFDKIEKELGKSIVRHYSVLNGDDHFFDIVCEGAEYKSFRIHKGFKKTTPERKKGIRMPREGCSMTVLKAFDKAPCWKRKEVDIVINILKQYGMTSSSYKILQPPPMSWEERKLRLRLLKQPAI